MITLITAVPGSGKTLYSISLIDKALRDGRQVYTNIDSLVLDKFHNNSNLHPAPLDWTLVPDGSLVVYDEAQQLGLYPADAKAGLVTDPRLKAMETHRHRGIDLVFITQSPTLVHHHIRKLCGEHVHFYRGRGSRVVAKYVWSHSVSNPNNRGEQSRASSSLFRFPKKYFSYYQSATIHTHRFSVPWGPAALFAFIFSAVGFIAYRLLSSGGLSMFEVLM